MSYVSPPPPEGAPYDLPYDLFQIGPFTQVNYTCHPFLVHVTLPEAYIITWFLQKPLLSTTQLTRGVEHMRAYDLRLEEEQRMGWLKEGKTLSARRWIISRIRAHGVRKGMMGPEIRNVMGEWGRRWDRLVGNHMSF